LKGQNYAYQRKLPDFGSPGIEAKQVPSGVRLKKNIEEHICYLIFPSAPELLSGVVAWKVVTYSGD
jgi:hypothetical protein